MLDGLEKMSSMLKHSCREGTEEVVKAIVDEDPGLPQEDCEDGVNDIVRLLVLG